MKRVRDPDGARQAIENRRLTRRELATLAGCTVGNIGFILDGQSTDPALARRLARALRRPVAELFEDVASTGEQAIVEPRATA